MNNIVRDCGEIWTRLFDHRPFLSGEVIYFQEEFEGKRGDREISKLFQALESVTDIRDTQIDKLENSSVTSLTDLQTKLDKSLFACKAILDTEDKYDVDTHLEAKRQVRKYEWENFEAKIEASRLNYDSEEKESEKQMRKFYEDLEKKLHIEDPAKSQ